MARKRISIEDLFIEAAHCMRDVEEKPGDAIAWEQLANMVDILERFDPPLALQVAIMMARTTLRRAMREHRQGRLYVRPKEVQ